MSVDLRVSTEHIVTIQQLIKNSIMVLRKLINFEDIPKIGFFIHEGGQLHPFNVGKIGEKEEMYILSYVERDDKVAVISTNDPDNYKLKIITFSVGATRSVEEYILGLSAAIALGLLVESEIYDETSFWGFREHNSSALSLIEEMCIKDASDSFQSACRRFIGNRMD